MKSRVLSVVFRFAKFGAQVGPELLSHVAEGVQQDVGAPDVEGVAQGALALRVVGVRNSSGHGVADDFRGIELKGATVTVVTKCGSWHTSCDAHAALAELEVARVLMKQRGKHGGRHQRANSRGGVEGAIPFGVTLETLAIGRVAVVRLAE